MCSCRKLLEGFLSDIFDLISFNEKLAGSLEDAWTMATNDLLFSSHKAR